MKKIIILSILLSLCIKSNAQDIKWVYEFKGANSFSISKNVIHPPVVDSKGNSFVLIQVTDTLLINNQKIINDKKACIVLVSLDSNGIFKWIYTMKAGDQLSVKDIITTSDGSVVLIGNYNSEMQLPGGGKLDSFFYNNGFMIKIGTAGNLVWSKSHKYSHGSENAKLASDNLGDIYVHLLKYVLGAMVNDTVLQTQQGAAIAKFDKDGKFLKMNGNIISSVGNITVSGNGNHLYIFNTLESQSNIQFDSFTLKDSTLKQVEKDFYIACANSNLDFIFLERFQAKSTYAIDHLFYKSLCVDHNEDLYFAYSFLGKLDIAGNNYKTFQHFPIWLKIDTTGAIKWAITNKDSNGYYGTNYNMGTTKDNNVYSCFNAAGTYQIGALNVSKRAFLNMYLDKNANVYAAREFWSTDLPQLSGTVTSDGECTYVLQINDSIWYNQKYYGNGADKIVFVKLANPNYNINVNNIQSAKNITLYPNPTNGIATIEYTANKKEMLNIYNMLGETVYQNHWLPSQTQQTIDINKLPNGLYIIRLGDSEMKFVKQ